MGTHSVLYHRIGIPTVSKLGLDHYWAINMAWNKSYCWERKILLRSLDSAMDGLRLQSLHTQNIPLKWVNWSVLDGKWGQIYQIRSDQSLIHVRLFATPWIAARQASLSITNSWSSLRLTSIESEMPSSHLILCRPLLLPPPIPPSIRVFSNESTLRMRRP